MDDYSKKENFEKTLTISKEKLGFNQNSDPLKFNHQEFLTKLKNVNLKKKNVCIISIRKKPILI